MRNLTISVFCALCTITVAEELVHDAAVLVPPGVVGAILKSGTEVQVIGAAGDKVKIRYDRPEVSIEGVIPKSSLGEASVPEPEVQAKILSANVYLQDQGLGALPTPGRTRPQPGELLRQSVYLDLQAPLKFRERRGYAPTVSIYFYVQKPDSTRSTYRTNWRAPDVSTAEVDVSRIPGLGTKRHRIYQVTLPRGSRIIAWAVEIRHRSSRTPLETVSYPSPAALEKLQIKPDWW